MHEMKILPLGCFFFAQEMFMGNWAVHCFMQGIIFYKKKLGQMFIFMHETFRTGCVLFRQTIYLVYKIFLPADPIPPVWANRKAMTRQPIIGGKSHFRHFRSYSQAKSIQNTLTRHYRVELVFSLEKGKLCGRPKWTKRAFININK